MPPRTGKPGRPRSPFTRWPEDAVYATVKKTYRKGKVAAVDRKLVHGTDEDLASALETSSASGKINTAFVERQNGTDRTYNARKARKTYQFSKDLLVHVAVSFWVLFCYNFHHLHRGLRLRLATRGYLHQTPAMVAGLAAHPLTVTDIITTQVVGFTPPPAFIPAHQRLRYAFGPAP